MNAKNIQYNLSGHGLLSLYAYPYTVTLYGFLENLNYDKKFHNTNQLGALKNSLHGAHYTRYEYILLQWYLIDKAKELSKGTGLGTQKDFFGKLACIDKNPTAGEILQVLSILTNMGHFPDTFATSKVILNMLDKNHRKFRSGYKMGLDRNQNILLDQMIEKFDIYNIHLMNAIFLLRRYKNRKGSKEIVEFSIKILEDYIDKDKSTFKKYWELYNIIRKLSYLILDSTYASVPLKLEISSVISNIENFIENKSIKGESLIDTIDQINVLLQESLYLSSNSIITVSQRSSDIMMEVNNYNGGNFGKISKVRELLDPSYKIKDGYMDFFKKIKTNYYLEINWDKTKSISLNYNDLDIYNDLFPSNLMQFESDLNKKTGKSYAIIGVAKNNQSDTFKIAFSFLKNTKNKNKIISLLKFISSVISFDNDLIENNYENNDLFLNYERLVKLLLEEIFSKKFSYELRYENIMNIKKVPYFIGRGSKKISDEINNYINMAKSSFADDDIVELKNLSEYLRGLDYHGYIIAFGGSTVIWENSREKAEFDGVVVFPNKRNSNFINFIESKNMSNGNTVAAKQLRKRMKLLKNNKYLLKYNDLKNKGSVCEISLE